MISSSFLLLAMIFTGALSLIKFIILSYFWSKSSTFNFFLSNQGIALITKSKGDVEYFKNDGSVAEKNLKKGSFCAVGEIGIDLHWDKTN